MAIDYKEEEERLINEDVENSVDDSMKRQEDRQKRYYVFFIVSCVLLLLAPLIYTKSPLHIRNCSRNATVHTAVPTHLKGIVESPVTDKHQHVKKDSNAESQPEVCDTAVCKKYSQTILSNMAPNYKQLDPCDNFDAYLCDGFRQHQEIKPFQSRTSTMDIVREEVEDILVGMFNGSAPFKSTQTGELKTIDEANYKVMQNIWNICMDEEAMKKYGIQPIQKILEEFEKVFPVQGPPLSGGSNEELTNVAIWFYKYGGNGLFGVDSMTNKSAPDNFMLDLGGAELSFAKKHYQTNPTLISTYSQALAEMQQVLKSGKPIYEAPIEKSDESKFKAKAQRIVDFEKFLSLSTPDASVAHNITYYNHLSSLSEIQNMVPEINLIKYVKAVVPSEYKVTPELVVNVGDYNYFQNLSSIIKETSRETLHDFFQTTILKSLSGTIQSNFTVPLTRVNNIKSGLKPDLVHPRYKRCLASVERSLPYMISGLYVSEAFTKKDKTLGDTIVDQVREIFKKRFSSLDWLSEESRPTAVKKVDAMVQKIGYQSGHPDVSSPKEVQDYYKDKLTFSPSDNWFELNRKFHAVAVKVGWELFLKPLDPMIWSSTAPTVNAFYSSAVNSITFPAGIMRSPIFSADLPDYVSYGSFGAVAGHEVTHAFDDNGSKYDEKRIMQDWWDQKTKNNFHERTQCFIDQYSNYTVPGLNPGEQLHVDGKLTLSENVADAGGLSAAYEAWKKYGTKNQRLPGLEQFNSDQMFFIAYGNFWCSKSRKESTIDNIFKDPHSPSGKRIIGTTANNAAFKQAFGCPVKKPTCALW